MYALTPDDAREQFTAAVRDILSCITRAPLAYSASQGHERLAFDPGPVVPLNCNASEAVSFGLVHDYTLEQSAGSIWQARTSKYSYHLHDAQRQALFRYDWHPHTGLAYPHLHLCAGAGPLRSDIGKAHFPTGPIALETVVQFLISAFRVRPIRNDWRQVIASHQEQPERCDSTQVSHVGLWVDDLERARAFYERWFAARAGKRYESARRPMQSYFLSLGGEAQIEIMQCPEEKPRMAHTAISVGSEEALDQLYREMTEAGVTVLSPPRRTGDGMYEMAVADSAGNPLEVTA